jgi:predicted RND superfamily exporter protein
MILLLLITVFMGSQIKHLQWSFDLANIVPDKDEDMIYFKQFRETFGEDGNKMAFGIKDSSIYEIDAFKEFSKLTNSIDSKKGVNSVIGIPNLQKYEKDGKSGSFKLKDVFEKVPETQEELDNKLEEIAKIRFYSGQLIKKMS